MTSQDGKLPAPKTEAQATIQRLFIGSELSVAKFAKAVGISRETVSRLLHGKTTPRDDTATKFSAWSGRPVSDFSVSRKREDVSAVLQSEAVGAVRSSTETILEAIAAFRAETDARLRQLEAAASPPTPQSADEEQS